MAWTQPKTDFSPGNVLTAAQMNAIGANLVAGVPAAVRVRRNAGLGINNATDTFLSFTTEDFDVGGMFAAGSASQVTIPVNGVYQVNVSVFWQANSAGARVVNLMKNPASATDQGSIFAGAWSPASPSPIATVLACSGLVSCVSTDVIKVGLYQNSGGGLDAGDATFTSITQLSVTWIGTT